MLTRNLFIRSVTAIIIAAFFFCAKGEPVSLAQASDVPAVRYKSCVVPVVLKDVVAGPTVLGDVVLLGHSDGSVTALSVPELTVLWKAELGGRSISNFAADDDSVYLVTTANGDETATSASVYALSKTTGLTNAKANIPFAKQFKLALGKSGVIVAPSAGAIRVLDRRDLSAIGVAVMHGEGLMDVTLLGERVIGRTSSGGLAINGPGSEQTTVSEIGDNAISAFANGNGSKLFAGGRGGEVIAIDADEGLILWRYKTGGAVSQLAYGNGSIYAASHDNFFYKISGDSGRVEWRRRMPGRMTFAPAMTSDSVFVPVIGESSIFVISRDSGKLSNRIEIPQDSFPSSDLVSPPNGEILMRSGDRLIRFSTANCP